VSSIQKPGHIENYIDDDKSVIEPHKRGMVHVPVASSNIQSVAHNPFTKTMEVIFTNGSHYSYADVSPEKHKALMQADSVGSHFHKHFKTGHAFTKLK
jgi:hypothetical protein